jgi:hypothetical protein
MKLVDFDFEPEWLNRFLDWPREHYASNPNWMPDPAEPRFLCSGNAARRNFLVVDGQEIRGRITAMINPTLLDDSGHPYAQLGFFECSDDPQVARMLVEPALGWLRDHLPEGSTVLAPMNFDTWHAYRLRTGGFEEPTFMMEPYNPSFYPAIFAALDFAPISQYVTKTVTHPATLMSAWEEHHRAAIARGYRFRSIDPAALDSEMSLIHRLSLATFCDNLFFTGIPEEEFRALYAGAASRLDPHLLIFLLDPQGIPVGLSFSSPDARMPATVNLKTFGVLPRVRGEGAGAALAYESYRRFAERGFQQVNHCLMRVGNRADHFDGGLGEVTREYALYARSL